MTNNVTAESIQLFTDSKQVPTTLTKKKQKKNSNNNNNNPSKFMATWNHTIWISLETLVFWRFCFFVLRGFALSITYCVTNYSNAKQRKYTIIIGVQFNWIALYLSHEGKFLWARVKWKKKRLNNTRQKKKQHMSLWSKNKYILNNTILTHLQSKWSHCNTNRWHPDSPFPISPFPISPRVKHPVPTRPDSNTECHFAPSRKSLHNSETESTLNI